MISGKIDDVANTKIIVAALNNNRQLIVYSNTVKLSNEYEPVAMILPFPNGAAGVRVIETKPTDNGCFDTLEECFEEPTFGAKGTFRSMSYSANGAEPLLTVHRSGSYRYSVAANTADMKRIDRSVFQISNDLSALLAQYENRGFGFIVCIIDKSANYSPFAYISSNLNGRLFVPTKHYHQHGGGFMSSMSGMGYGSFAYDGFASYNPNMLMHHDYNSAGYSADWDHNIYVVGSALRLTTCNIGVPAKAAYSGFNDTANYSFSKLLQAGKSRALLSKFRINGGDYPNDDIILPIIA